MKILIAGDLVPTKSNEDMFINADIKSLLGEELFSLWYSVDIRIFNLETPITNQITPISKCGPNLFASLDTIRGIKELNPSVITLANNHIFDQGIPGFISTRDILQKSSIPFVGAGINLFDAKKPYVLNKDGIKVGVFNCTEHEFSIATDSIPGANPFDPIESFDDIKELKDECDYVIVIYHGGKEHYRYPSPYIQKICKKMVQKGADIVVCQHSHCIGSFENFNNSTIVYGQGNFVFDYSNSDFWQTSLLIKIEINEEFLIEYVPIIKEGNVVKLADESNKEEILSSFLSRSEEILREGFIEEKYKEFADLNIETYIRNLSGLGKWLSRIDRYLLNGWLLGKIYNPQRLLAIRNHIECEAHRELLIAGLVNKGKSDRNDKQSKI